MQAIIHTIHIGYSSQCNIFSIHILVNRLAVEAAIDSTALTRLVYLCEVSPLGFVKLQVYMYMVRRKSSSISSCGS